MTATDPIVIVGAAQGGADGGGAGAPEIRRWLIGDELFDEAG